MMAGTARERATDARDVFDELVGRGYRLSVETRQEVTHRSEGPHVVTYANLLTVRGPEPPSAELIAAIAEHRDELLAAACVVNPPVAWLKELAARCRERFVFVSTKTDATGKNITYRVTPEVLAANVAAFIGKRPAYDGPALVPIVRHAVTVAAS
jgi:hypothetical protein